MTLDRLDERYGRGPSRGRRWAVGIVAALGAAAIGLLGWSTVSGALGAVDVTTTGFRLVDEQTVSLTFQFTGPPSRPVACILEAQDEEHGVVGWKVVRYEASEEHAGAFRESIPTTAPATTGFVNSCWVT